MRRNPPGIWLALVAALATPAVASAQTPSFQDVQVADIETMKDKFVALAGAFSEAQYDWRPMEGVRSVQDVFALMVAECYNFPVAWGHDAPARASGGFRGEMERAGGLSKAEMIDELGMAFDHMIGIVRGMDEAERTSDSQYFGRTMDVRSNIFTATSDMHEHLGQLIAYARTNRVVPPWSR